MLFAIVIVGAIARCSTAASSPAITSAQPDSTYASDAPADSAEEEPLASYAQLDVPLICQFPDLPTGCEITAATMALNYYGFNAEALDVDAYLAKTYDPFTVDPITGITYGPDPDTEFLGDTRAYEGLYCLQTPIADALNGYIADNGGGYTAIALKGESVERLYRYVQEGTPVIIWTTIDMGPCDTNYDWMTEDGIEMHSSTQYHAMVLTGFDVGNATVFVNDPLTGEEGAYSMDDFETSYHARDDRAVVIAKWQS